MTSYRMYAIAALVLIATSVCSYGRVGETKEQCDARYGAGTQNSNDAKAIDYKKGDFEITIIFVNNKAVSIVYLKHSPIFMEECDAFIKSNAGNTQMLSGPGEDQWHSVDNNIFAGKLFREGKFQFIVFNKEYLKLLEKEKAEQGVKNMQGF